MWVLIILFSIEICSLSHFVVCAVSLAYCFLSFDGVLYAA